MTSFDNNTKMVSEIVDEIIDGYTYPITLERGAVKSMMNDLLEEIRNKINGLIQADDRTLEHERIGKEAKFIAQISKNNSILVREMLKL